MPEHCIVTGCRREVELTYLGRPYCGVHWAQLCKHTQTRDIAAAKEDEKGGED